MSGTPIRALVRAAIELTSRHEREAVLDAVLAELERLVPYDMACVLVLDGDTLLPVATRGFRRDRDLAHTRYPVGSTPRLDRALGAMGTVRFTDPHEPDPFDGLSTEPLGHLHSCMAAPMRVEGRLLGVITADAHRTDAFGPPHEELMELFAALAAVAIRNADLVTRLESLRREREGQVVQLTEAVRQSSRALELVGSSAPMRALREELGVVGPTDTNVLVLGETGTGKEVVARALHALSRRAERPLIRFDCSAVAAGVIESELYGHARGAFTGAVSERPGKFEVADGSTLFLDEVGELPLALQPRLLRALQEREVERVGEHRVRRVNVRVIAATNRDLEAEVRAGRFRADLFHRLSVYPLRLPALAERREDIPELVHHFVRRLTPRLRLGPVRVEDGFLEELARYAWPGNVRELENTVERALVRARGAASLVLDREAARALGLAGEGAPRGAGVAAVPLPRVEGGSLRAATEAFQLQLIEAALAQCEGNLSEAARVLGEDRSNLHRRLRRLRDGGGTA